MSNPKYGVPDPTSKGARGSERQLSEYNYEHFRAKHLLADLYKTVRGEGVRPGEEAPDFELESTGGERVRLGGLRGRPVVLRFGSFT